MPIQKCTNNGQDGWQWGQGGVCYTGPDAQAQAQAQGMAASYGGDLPPMAESTDSRHRSWVIVASEPGFVYEGETHTVDLAWASQQVAEFERLTDQGYKPPVLAEHQRDGSRLGDVEALQVHTDTAGRLVLLAAVSWAIDNAEDLIKTGRLLYASPGFAQIEDERGRSFDQPYVLNELSVVSSPHQKSMGNHILNKEQIMNENNDLPAVLDAAPEMQEEEDNQASEVVESIRALEAKLDELATRLTAMEEEYKSSMTAEDGEEQETEASETATTEVAALREQVKRLESERAKDRFAMGHKDLLMGMSEAQIGGLFDAWQTSPAGFNTMLGLLKGNGQKVASQIASTPWAARLGESTDVSEIDSKPATKADLHAQAIQQSGGDKIKALALYKQMLQTNQLN